MNRCQRHFTPTAQPRRRYIAWALTACLTAGLLVPTASIGETAMRPFPASAKRGTFEVKAPPEVLIDGTPARLSPGARIRGTNNMLVMSGQIIGKSLTVNYTRDPLGAVHEVWILTEAEAAAPRAGKGPLVNFSFGSDGDKPKADDGKTPYNQLPGYQKP